MLLSTVHFWATSEWVVIRVSSTVLPAPYCDSNSICIGEKGRKKRKQKLIKFKINFQEVFIFLFQVQQQQQYRSFKRKCSESETLNLHWLLYWGFVRRLCQISLLLAYEKISINFSPPSTQNFIEFIFQLKFFPFVSQERYLQTTPNSCSLWN